MSLGILNYLLGGMFGALKFALIVSVLLNVLAALDPLVSFIAKETKEHSFCYNSIIKITPYIWEKGTTIKSTDAGDEKE